MKVVLFCGGLGMRLKETEESLPKPLVRIGYMPILWHVMKYYAHFGHKDFILCLGYKADVIKQYFLTYNECILNDFVMTNGGHDIQLLNHDMKDWRITFVDTGMYCTVGQRLKLVRHHLEGEEMFLANYSDGLTDVPLSDLINFAQQESRIATFLCVKPNLTYHFVTMSDHGRVTEISDIRGSNIRINGGFYVFRQGILTTLRMGRNSSPARSSGLLTTTNSAPSPTMASGRAWIRSKTNNNSKTCTPAVRPRGKSGSSHRRLPLPEGHVHHVCP